MVFCHSQGHCVHLESKSELLTANYSDLRHSFVFWDTTPPHRDFYSPAGRVCQIILQSFANNFFSYKYALTHAKIAFSFLLHKSLVNTQDQRWFVDFNFRYPISKSFLSPVDFCFFSYLKRQLLICCTLESRVMYGLLREHLKHISSWLL